MRYVYITLIVVFTGLVAIFMLQNLEMVMVSFFSLRIALPAYLLAFAFYVLGMLTGGSLLEVLRTWIHRASQPRRPAA
jgi:lipopolysaccharide assembly protein A